MNYALSQLRPFCLGWLNVLVVKDHIFPAIPRDQLHDRFGFKATDSTAAPLVDLSNSVAIMLEDNTYVIYVRYLLVDFSKKHLIPWNMEFYLTSLNC